ncbi:hypothetical protein [Rubrimonas cliftonensis]|uniref:Transglycosylase SLT domain-containing protein n=1 Tax=Rubrimonas cliftonensis TaxID=89524 RepID=A0A1H3XIR3_9RHOB|nr:hypothetical protein [Rubrimonas cliftonensis]SDZ98534.1 hypothetical protein SAMN05444370_102418 [Rubrimonas cliftonensis]
MPVYLLRWGALALALFTVGCGSSDRMPRNTEDICAIYQDNPHWRRAVAQARDKWGAPEEVKMAIIWRESSFRAEARPPRTYTPGIPTGRVSSAYGYSQAIDGTWDWYEKDTGHSGDRDEFEDAIDFVGWYMAKTRRANGVAMNDAYNQYLNYHEGHAGYRRGDWRNKAWLMRAAAQVQAQADRYRLQASRCRA